MFLTFNDLSARINRFESESDARSEISDFAKFCKDLSSASAVDEMIFPETLLSEPLYCDYSIARWLCDKTVSLEHRRYLRSFLDKHRRYYSNNDIDGEFEVSLDGEEYSATGCAFALEHENTLLSLPTHELWRSRTVCGNYTSLDENGEMQCSQRSVDNLWSGVSIEDIAAAERDKTHNAVTSGQDLWEQRETLYPNLIFCENVKRQLFDDSEQYHISAVMKRLERFQEYFSDCGETYDPDDLGMDARTESASVKNNPVLKEKRKFRLPNGKEEYFFDHVGFHGKYPIGRIHFLPDNKNKRCYIGYIGNHLSTQKHKF